MLTVNSGSISFAVISTICALYGLHVTGGMLRRRHIRKRRRIPIYNILSENLEEQGLVTSDWENFAESPRDRFIDNETDELFFGGFDNRSRNSVSIKLTRNGHHELEIWMLVTLKSDVKRSSTYKIPINSIYQENPAKSNNYWGTNDLRIYCISPNRKYRISYNGLLRNEETGAMEHITFSLSWRAFTEFVDFYQYANPQNESFMDQYEHYGMFLGTYTIEDGEEQEIELWGVRNRKLQKPNEEGSSRRIYAYMKNGTAVGITLYQPKGSKKSIMMGSLMNSLQNITKFHPDDKVKDCLLEVEKTGMGTLYFCAGKCKYQMYISIQKDETQEGHTKLYPAKFALKNLTHSWSHSGKGIYEAENMRPRNLPLKEFNDIPRFRGTERNLEVVDIRSKNAADESFVGGKAASLAVLWKLMDKIDYKVPIATFVTVAAFENHLNRNKALKDCIKDLDVGASHQSKSLEENSKCIFELMKATEISSSLKTEIENSLNSLFTEGFDNKLFSVRSSAVGEDGEEMSSAGQMDTFLGVKGINEILAAIKKCWASCFSLRALQYRRQYGQLLVTEMAVIIQEMVNADSAGVMFTREPMNGNPSLIMISSNRGLGESVVNGSCEPDNITLQRKYSNDFNEDEVLSVKEYVVGKKNSQVYLNVDGGITEKESSLASERSISDKMALILGKIGLSVEKELHDAKDIEWAINGDTVYLLQARPITTFHKETDYEIIHEFDSALITDHECLTSGNIGEVIPSVLSPLGNTYGLSRFTVAFMSSFGNTLSSDMQQIFNNVFKDRFGNSTHGRSFMPRTDNFTYANESTSSWNDVSMNGRVIDLPEVAKDTAERFKGFSSFTVKSIFAMIWLYLRQRSYAKRMQSVKLEYVDVDQFKTMDEVYSYLEKTVTMSSTALYHALFSTLSSTMNYQIIRTLRMYATDDTDWTDVTSDLAKLLEHCGQEGTVESADIPHTLQALVTSLAAHIDPSVYCNMSTKEALDYVTGEDCPVKSSFDDFMKRHGHRCINEFDLEGEAWELYPLQLIKSTQVMMKGHNMLKQRESSSVEDSISQLKTKVSNSDRKKLMKQAKLAREFVGYREQSKALIIRSVHVDRKLFIHLADMMFDAGMLPYPRLIFFFTFTEIKEFMRNRSPKIIQRAMRRKRMQEYMKTLVFPEVMHGIPKPLPKVRIEHLEGEENITLTGTPVCHGEITAKVRLALSVQEAEELQPGEILVAKSTDIAWSPFFPIAGGIITELGGLISHGAVVAREYGLPCVINITDVTAILSTGDLITLDGRNGTVQRIQQAQQ